MLNRHQIKVLLFSMLILALFASVPAPVAGRSKTWPPDLCDSRILAPVRHVMQHLPCGLPQAQRFRQGLQGCRIQVS